MLASSCLRGVHSWQRPTLPPIALKHMRNGSLSSAVSFGQRLCRSSVRAPGTFSRHCMAASVPSDMDTRPESDGVLNSAKEKARPDSVDGMLPAQRLDLDAQSQAPGLPGSLPQNSEKIEEEMFEYSWEDCSRESPVLTSQVRILTWNTLADGLAQHGDFVKVSLVIALTLWELLHRSCPSSSLGLTA